MTLWQFYGHEIKIEKEKQINIGLTWKIQLKQTTITSIKWVFNLLDETTCQSSQFLKRDFCSQLIRHVHKTVPRDVQREGKMQLRMACDGFTTAARTQDVDDDEPILILSLLNLVRLVDVSLGSTRLETSLFFLAVTFGAHQSISFDLLIICLWNDGNWLQLKIVGYATQRLSFLFSK